MYWFQLYRFIISSVWFPHVPYSVYGVNYDSDIVQNMLVQWVILFLNYLPVYETWSLVVLGRLSLEHITRILVVFSIVN